MRSFFAIALLFLCASSVGSGVPVVSERESSKLAGEARRPPISFPREVFRPVPDPIHQPITAQQIINHSALIFSGTVLNIKHQNAGRNTTPGVTQITFRVQDAIRGVRRGELIHVREWAGLWNAGERYRAGETLFMFLYPPSELGLTSPVGGAAGKFDIQHGRVLIRPQHVFFRTGARVSSMDVKDFAAQLRRAGKE